MNFGVYFLFLLLISCNGVKRSLISQPDKNSSPSSSKIDEDLASTPQGIFSTIQTESGLLFIRVDDPNFVIDDILLSGRLVRTGNCLRIVNDDKGISATAIWGSHVHAIEEGEQIKLSNVYRVNEVNVSDEIEFSATRFDNTHSGWSPLMPNECDEPYYVVGEVISVSTETLIQESESVGFVNDITVFFPQQKNMGRERETMAAELIGTLVMEEGCLRIEEPYSETSYLPIWPPEFKLEKSEENATQNFEIDGTQFEIGQTVYIDGGEMLSISGVGLIDETMQEQIQQKCSGPYWLVGNELWVVDGEN